MRRAAPTGPLSPKLLKHFAAVTVGLTALLALFSSGADWGAPAQIGAVEAKNQLLTTEAERLGARRVAARINIREVPRGLNLPKSQVLISVSAAAAVPHRAGRNRHCSRLRIMGHSRQVWLARRAASA